MKILHIADLHLRGLSRHDEIRAISEDLFKKTQNQSIDQILIAGDVFHTKTTGITAEYIDLLSWLLNELSRIAPVAITLGNHDFAQNNLTRQDAVSPIVSALNNPRITLYKQSGNFNLNLKQIKLISLFIMDVFKVLKLKLIGY